MRRAWLLLVALLVACGGGAPGGLQAPTGLTAEAQDGAVLLGWNASPTAGLAGYLVRVSTQSGALVRNEDVPACTTELLVTGLTNGTTYVFSVLAEAEGGQRSPASASVVATPQAPNAPPSTPTGFTAAAQDQQVLLSWDSPPAGAPVAEYMLHFGVAGGPLASTQQAPGSATSAVVTGLTNGTSYQFQLEAVGAGGAKSARTAPVTATPQANLNGPLVLSVSVVGYGSSTQLRQGAGAVEVQLTGERLDGLTSARLLGAFDLSVLEASPTSARLGGTVPHGLEIGPRTLTVSTPAGEYAVANALEITKIVAAKTPGLNPSDTTGTGTPNLPFLTLSKALSVAGEGDTVLLGAGTYGEGENWPTGGVTPSANVPAGVSVEGMSSDRGAVLLDGGGGPQTDGLAFAGSASVTNLSLRGFRYGLFGVLGTNELRQGQVEVRNVAAFDNLAGLWLQYADGLVVEDSAFRNNSVGSASGWGLLVQGVRNVDLRSVEVIGNHVGLRLTTVAGAASSASLDGLSVTTNASHGVRVTNVSTFLRNTRVADNVGDGLRFEGRPPSLQVGAGTVLEQNNGTQLVDLRDANQGTFRVSRYALAGVSVGTYIGPAQQGNVYSIQSAGNGFIVE